MNYTYKKRRKAKGAYLAIILSLVIVTALAVCGVVLLLTRNTNEAEAPVEDVPDGRPVIDEVRGVWVPSVYNLTFPSKADLSKEELQAEIDSILDTAEKSGLNSVFFQVRPSCDALYPSKIFSVSSVLSTDGTLKLDCLGYMVEKAHEKGIAIYAWVNPLRVTAAKCGIEELPETSAAYALKDTLVSYDGRLYFDAGRPEVRKLICDGVKEIAENYKVDGIVFDDYFYPYPVYEENDDGTKSLAVFADEATFAEYGNGMTLSDFRRENINTLIKEAYETIKQTDNKISFGVAPFGIWQNDDGSNGGSLTKGAQSYSDNYSDTLAWIKEGYVDFIAPQLYWDMNSTAASYKVLSKWWDARVSECNEAANGKDSHEISLLISHGIYRYADSFSEGEITNQLEYSSELPSYKGSVFYAFNALRDNENGVTDEIKNYYASKDSAEAESDN